jgi:hypothetical protein
MNEIRLIRFLPDDKAKWWGEGEWVNEPDLVKFEHQGIGCMVLRMAMEEPDTKEFHMFGGYLNGYVTIPPDHPYYQKTYEEIPIVCHGGLTFGECSSTHLIGFDCSHCNDFVPSTEHMKKTAVYMQEYRDSMEKLKKNFNLENSPIFRNTYKNIEFCINECKSMAEQLIELRVEHES